MFHHDNDRSHTSLVIRQKLEEFNNTSQIFSVNSISVEFSFNGTNLNWFAVSSL